MSKNSLSEFKTITVIDQKYNVCGQIFMSNGRFCLWKLLLLAKSLGVKEVRAIFGMSHELYLQIKMRHFQNYLTGVQLELEKNYYPHFSQKYKAEDVILSSDQITASSSTVERFAQDKIISAGIMICDTKFRSGFVSINVQYSDHPKYGEEFHESYSGGDGGKYHYKDSWSTYTTRPNGVPGPTAYHTEDSKEAYQRMKERKLIIGVFTTLPKNFSKFFEGLDEAAGIYYSVNTNSIISKGKEVAKMKEDYDWEHSGVTVTVDFAMGSISFRSGYKWTEGLKNQEIIKYGGGVYVIVGMYGYKNFFPKWTVKSVNRHPVARSSEKD